MGARRILMAFVLAVAMVPTAAAAAATPTTDFPITQPVKGGTYPAGADVPLGVDASFSLVYGLTILLDGAPIGGPVLQVIQHQPASIPAPAPGRHTLQLQTFAVFPWPTGPTGPTTDCRVDGGIIATVCTLSSQIVHFAVLAPGQDKVPPVPRSTAVALLRRQIATYTEPTPSHLHTRCSVTANDPLGTTYVCAARWADTVYAWNGTATVRVTGRTSTYAAAVTFTGRRARRACVRAHGLRRCQKPARFRRSSDGTR